MEIKHPDEEKLKNEIDVHLSSFKMIFIKINKFINISYHKDYDKLKEVKAEIERIQVLLEQKRERMQKDFEKWLNIMFDQRKLCCPKIDISSEMKSVSGLNDKILEKKLEAFYKAREEIYKA